jgi:outer membrane receptor protein involved in Fe transport
MWNYNSSYLSGLNTADPSSSSFFGAREQWDFFARFKITEKFNVFLDVINVLEENRSIYQGQVSAARQVQTNLFPRTITAGIQARF